MRNSHKALSLTGTLVLMASLASSCFAQSAAPKSQTIGVVDRDKVVMSYPKAQQAADELRKSEEKVQKLIEDSNKQYEDAKNAHKTPAELEGLQRRLQTDIDAEVKKVQARAQTLETQLETEIDGAIKAEAGKHRIDIVLQKPAILMGGVDLTEAVVKHISEATAAAPTKSTTK